MVFERGGTRVPRRARVVDRMAVVVLSAVLASACGTRTDRLEARTAASIATTTSTTSTSTTTTVPPTTTTTTPPPTTTSPQATVDAIVAEREGVVTWSVVDLATGERVSSSAAEEQVPMASASIVKVLIATMAIEQGVAGLYVRSDELAAMITESDNDAASDLYDAVGGAAALGELMARAAMTSSEPGSSWGLMQVTADDMATFLAQLATGQVLGPYNEVVLDLMRDVVIGQRWGIEEGVAAGVPVALKNGWYPDTDGRWRVHCTAIVGDPHPTEAGQGVAIVVMNHYDEALGMSYGEDTCRMVAEAALPVGLRATRS